MPAAVSMIRPSQSEFALLLVFGNTSTAQHSTAQHSTAQHSTAQHSTAQHSTAQHSTAQHSTAQHSTAQQGATDLCKQPIRVALRFWVIAQLQCVVPVRSVSPASQQGSKPVCMVQQNWAVSILLGLNQTLSFSVWAIANLAWIIAKHGNKRLSVSETLPIIPLPFESDLQNAHNA